MMDGGRCNSGVGGGREIALGDPITDCGQRYIVLESKSVGDSCVVLELESRVDHQLQVIEKSFPAGYQVDRAHHRIL
ncbi:hypothetical protein MSTO_37150 [Mycobacterium stomatepiae]|uniref:Uncharacterized protein n=1 Tax=Mycobacterium stomatepiae TaxID=470076 RepID=A0A7I7QB28_9MYCO|nr:hypothetical protein MSTO_37150 [Mycobacterium stomatepiae]